jgi:DNA-binding transcriptional MerR regulator
MAKAKDAFRTISEVAEWLDTPTHVLRFWESKFSQIKPVKGAGGRRYYRPTDMDLLGGIKQLLHEDGLTIKGTQKLLREKGVKHVAALGPTMSHAVDAPAPPARAPAAQAPAPQPAPAPVAATAPAPAAVQPAPVKPAPVQDPPVQDAFPFDAATPASPAPAIEFPALPKGLPNVPARLIGRAPVDPSDLQARKAQIVPLLARLQTLHDRVAG